MTLSHHEWIRITQESVDIVVDPDGLPFACSRPGESIGEAVGCNACGVVLNSITAFSPCQPEQVEVAL